MAKPKTAKPASAEVATLDPLSVNNRLYRQIDRLLKDLEDRDNKIGVTIPQRISALIAIGRIQTIFMGLRKEEAPRHVGSKPQQYSRAFTARAHDSRRGKKGGGRSSAAAAIAADFDAADDAATDD